MKNKLLKIVTGALSILCLAGCNNKISKTDEISFPGVGYQDVDYLAVKGLNIGLTVGEVETIDLDAMPNAASSKVTFTSSDPAVVNVSDTGVISGLKKGLSVISVNRLDGSLLGKVNVIVTGKDSTNRDETIAAMEEVYQDPLFKNPKKVHKREYSYEEYYKAGKLDHSYCSYDDTYFDANKLYFAINGDDLFTYTQDGARELADGKWIFQVQGMKTRMIHMTSTVKNYYDFTNPDYGNNLIQIIYDLLDMFFVSGKEIVDDLVDWAAGKENFEHYLQFKDEDGIHFYADGNGNMTVGIAFNGEKGTVTTKEEIDTYDIYQGTPYTEDYLEEYIYQNAKCIGMNIGATLNYEENSVKCSRSFFRSMQFEEEFSIEEYKGRDDEMADDGWNKVDNMYDL